MRNLTATFATISLLSITNAAIAGDYYSSQQSNNGGYTSSQTSDTGGYTSSQSSGTGGYSSSQTGTTGSSVMKKEKKSRFSVHVNFNNNQPVYVEREPDTYYVKSRGHHHYEPRWVLADNGEIPEYAVQGGYERGNPLYVCQVDYNGGTHPGKLVGENCNFSYGGREVIKADYQVLISQNELSWVPARNGNIPAHAIAGGYENGRPLYICQVNYMGGVHPGKIVGRNCNFGYAGREVMNSRYQVLVG